MTLRNTYNTKKMQMVNNLILKGVEADITDGLTTLANKISDISVLGELTDISVQVVKGDLNLAQLKIYLLRNNKIIGQQIASAANSWTCIFTDVPINCTVECDVSNQYTKAITGSVANGFVCTLTKEMGSLQIEETFDISEPEEEPEKEQTTSITVTTIWNDNSNTDLMRPASCTIHLSAGESEIENYTLSSANNWQHTFNDLPRYTNGHPVSYSVSCDPVAHYATQINDFTIRNTYQPETTSVSVRKVWDDNNNASGTRPASVRVTLSNGTSVILNDANGWRATISGLPVYYNHQEVNYTWTEQSLLGYRMINQVTSGTVTTITNAPFDEYDTAL